MMKEIDSLEIAKIMVEGNNDAAEVFIKRHKELIDAIVGDREEEKDLLMLLIRLSHTNSAEYSAKAFRDLVLNMKERGLM